MAESHERGWKTFYDNGWRYEDTGELCDGKRACKRCGCFPTKDGHDACLGVLPNVKSACCGHGVANSILMKEE